MNNQYTVIQYKPFHDMLYMVYAGHCKNKASSFH